MAKKKDYEIIFQDEYLIVVNKAPYLAVVPTRDPLEPSLVKLLQKQFDRHIYVAHRIDRDTSGVLVFALTDDVHKNLNLQFYKRFVEKKYIAICAGLIADDWQEVDKKLETDNAKKVRVSPKGKDAISHFRALEKSKKFSLTEVKIETGRQHQIRVHLTSEGHPLLGDRLYNASPWLKLSQIKRKYVSSSRSSEERPLIGRTALHAQSLAFKHPITKEKLTFTAEMPKDMRACWSQISKWDA